MPTHYNMGAKIPSSKKQLQKVKPNKHKEYDSRTAFECKEIGNKAFKEGKYHVAINAYANAIAKDPAPSTFYSNRAQCYYRVSKFANCMEDSERAIDRDLDNVKAHVLSARASIKLFIETSNVEVLRMGTQRCKYAVKVYKGQKAVQNVTFAKELMKKLEAVNGIYLRGVDRERSVQVMKYYQCKGRIQRELLGRLGKLLEVTGEAEYRSLQCPISCDYFSRPVVTSAGITYEENSIKEYLMHGNSIDPVTRKALNATIFIVNRNVRKAVNYLSSKHPWQYYDLQEGQYPDDS